MKKILLLISVISLSGIILLAVLGINPFSNIGKQVEKDYIFHNQTFMEFITENTSDVFINYKTYDKSSSNLCKIFEDLSYQYVLKNHDFVFFCKGYDGMTGIGLLYSEMPFSPNPKQKIIKVLDDKWFVISKHEL